MRTYYQGNPTDDVSCVEQGNCTKCNGVFAMYAAMDFKLDYNSNIFPCTQIETCLLDYTKTTVDKYYYCSNITSCYDYNSEDACTNDRCQVNNCAWNYINEELGKGVCKSNIPEYQDCGACEPPWCNRWLCQNFYGECYFNELGSQGPKGCIPKSQTTCNIYDTEDDCANPTGNFSINVHYNTSGRRDAGTHHVITNSSDYFDYKKCKWDDDQSGDQCYRDADDNSDSFPTTDLTKDCNFLDLKCSLDFGNPITTIVPGQEVLGGTSASIEYSVHDDVYSNPELSTYYCIVDREQTCYPSIQATYNRFFKSFLNNTNETKNFTLFYYSKDPAENLEEVHKYNFTADGTPLTGTITFTLGEPLQIGEDEWLTNLTVELNMSRDATCSAHMENTSSAEIQFINSFTGLYGSHWERMYVSLRDGRYSYVVDCTDSFGNTFHKVSTKIVEGDYRITNPQPSGTINYTNVILSIDTAYNGTCKYDS